MTFKAHFGTLPKGSIIIHAFKATTPDEPPFPSKARNMAMERVFKGAAFVGIINGPPFLTQAVEKVKAIYFHLDLWACPYARIIGSARYIFQEARDKVCCYVVYQEVY